MAPTFPAHFRTAPSCWEITAASPQIELCSARPPKPDSAAKWCFRQSAKCSGECGGGGGVLTVPVPAPGLSLRRSPPRSNATVTPGGPEGLMGPGRTQPRLQTARQPAGFGQELFWSEVLPVLLHFLLFVGEGALKGGVRPLRTGGPRDLCPSFCRAVSWTAADLPCPRPQPPGQTLRHWQVSSQLSPGRVTSVSTSGLVQRPALGHDRHRGCNQKSRFCPLSPFP